MIRQSYERNSKGKRENIKVNISHGLLDSDETSALNKSIDDSAMKVIDERTSNNEE